MAEDYYRTLGVGRDASPAEIQKAYRELARKHHPDMNPDDKNAKRKFQQVQAAFDVLNSPEKRKLYDRYGSAFESMGSNGPRPGGPGPGFPPGGGNVQFDEETFSQLFGGGGGGGGGGGFADIFRRFQEAATPKSRRGAARKGADVEAEAQIAFQTAISGGEVQIGVARPSGKVDTLTVKIPAGIEDGKKIRLRGQGQPGPRGAAAGDLLITIHVAPHPSFVRQGNHLLVKVPVTLGEAALGAKIDVPTPSGTVSLRVPPGASSGAKLRIKGRGVAAKDGTSGDLLAEVMIVLPKELADADRRAIEEVERRHPFDPRTNLQW